MKNKLTYFSIVYLLFAWSLPMLLYKKYSDLAFVLVYSLCVIVIMLIKNNKLSVFICFIIAILFSCFYSEFIVLFMIPLFSIFEYVNIIKKSERKKQKRKDIEKSSVGTTSALVLSAFLLIVFFVKSHNSIFDRHYRGPSAIIWGMFIVYLVIAFFSCSKSTAQSKKKECDFSNFTLKKLRYIHILHSVCFIETLLFYYIKVGYHDINFYDRTWFFPWFAYLVLMLFLKDPYVYIFKVRTSL